MNNQLSLVIDKTINLLELLGVIATVTMAFVLQFYMRELPCPLCLLQRYGFLAMAFGFLLNMRYGFKPWHYSIVIISAMFTSLVALRQVALHVIPGTGAYGNPFLGLHLYSWCFILATLIVIVTSVIMGLGEQYRVRQSTEVYSRKLTYLMFVIVTFLLLANMLSVLLECGLQNCPDNSVRYEVLQGDAGGKH